MKRNRKARDPKADEQVLARIKALKAIHPAWGCRRIHAYLRRQLKAEGVKKPINHKRIRRLMQEANLLVPARQTKAPRNPTKWGGRSLASGKLRCENDRNGIEVSFLGGLVIMFLMFRG